MAAVAQARRPQRWKIEVMAETRAPTPASQYLWPARRSSPHRSKWLLLALVSALGLLGSCWIMADKVRQYNIDEIRVFFVFDARTETNFSFGGRDVTIETERSDPENQQLLVTYGEDQLKMRVAIPGPKQLPGLLPHSDWLRLLRFAPMSGRSMEEYKRDLGTPALPERLAIVTRVPRPGADPKSWGEVWIKDWTFEFHEFLPPPGRGFESQRFKYPSHKRGQAPKPGELMGNTWQFQAALQLMPQQARERLMGKFRDAMSGLSWTLPLAALSGIACIFALGFAFAPFRPK